MICAVSLRPDSNRSALRRAPRPSKGRRSYRHRLADFEFDFHLDDITREYFRQAAKTTSGALAADMTAVAEGNREAMRRVAAASAPLNAMMRTTCVATQLEGGHATNALPQLAAANVNCRLLPDDSQHATEDLMQPGFLLSGAGAVTPLAIPNGAKRLRFFSNRPAQVRVDLIGVSEPTSTVTLGYEHGAQGVGTGGAHAAVVHRVDAGDNEVSYVITGLQRPAGPPRRTRRDAAWPAAAHGYPPLAALGKPLGTLGHGEMWFHTDKC